MPLFGHTTAPDTKGVAIAATGPEMVHAAPLVVRQMAPEAVAGIPEATAICASWLKSR